MERETTWWNGPVPVLQTSKRRALRSGRASVTPSPSRHNDLHYGISTVGWEHSDCIHFRDIELGAWEVVAKKTEEENKKKEERRKSQK